MIIPNTSGGKNRETPVEIPGLRGIYQKSRLYGPRLGLRKTGRTVSGGFPELLEEAFSDENERVRSTAESGLSILEEERGLRAETPKLDFARASVRKNLRYLSRQNVPGKKAVIEHLSKKEEAVSRLLKSRRMKNDELFEAGIEVLAGTGAPALPAMDRAFREGSSDAVLMSFYALQKLPFRESVGIIKENFAGLWREYNMELLETIEALGAADFIPLLKEELRPGEKSCERAYYMLCRLNGVDDPILAELKEKIEQNHREAMEKLRSYSEGGYEKFFEETINLNLECGGCGKRYDYELYEVFVSPVGGNKPPDVYITDDAACKNCSLANSFTPTRAGYATLAAWLDIIEMVKENRPDLPVEDLQPVKLARTFADGKEMRMPEAAEHYRKKVEEDPSDPEIRVALGNVLMKLKEYDAAEKEYEKALELNDKAVEAYYSLAEICAIREDFPAAFKFMKSGAEKLDRAVFYRTSDIYEFGENMLEELEYFEEKILESVPAQVIKKPKTPGTLPAQCGSGKKIQEVLHAGGRRRPNAAASHVKEFPASQGQGLKESVLIPSRFTFTNLM